MKKIKTKQYYLKDETNQNESDWFLNVTLMRFELTFPLGHYGSKYASYFPS